MLLNFLRIDTYLYSSTNEINNIPLLHGGRSSFLLFAVAHYVICC